MAENPNLNMALEAVLRDRDDLYRRPMQAESLKRCRICRL